LVRPSLRSSRSPNVAVDRSKPTKGQRGGVGPRVGRAFAALLPQR
jgi:hypothetical protein